MCGSCWVVQQSACTQSPPCTIRYCRAHTKRRVARGLLRPPHSLLQTRMAYSKVYTQRMDFFRPRQPSTQLSKKSDIIHTLCPRSAHHIHVIGCCTKGVVRLTVWGKYLIMSAFFCITHFSYPKPFQLFLKAAALYLMITVLPKEDFYCSCSVNLSKRLLFSVVLRAWNSLKKKTPLLMSGLPLPCPWNLGSSPIPLSPGTGSIQPCESFMHWSHWVVTAYLHIKNQCCKGNRISNSKIYYVSYQIQIACKCAL